MAAQFCDDLLTVVTIVVDPPPTPGAVTRDPDDDKIVACAIAASAEHIVSRDDHLLSLGNYGAFRSARPSNSSISSGNSSDGFLMRSIDVNRVEPQLYSETDRFSESLLSYVRLN